MIAISLDELPVGTAIARDIYDNKGQLLLPKGTLLTPQFFEALRRQSLGQIFVYEGDGTYLADEKDPNYTGPPPDNVEENTLATSFFDTVEMFRKMMVQAVEGHRIKKSDVEEAVDHIYLDVIHSNNILTSLQELRSKDDYTFEHSVAVSVLSIKIAQITGMKEKNVRGLGIAGLMHDIGKSKIPSSILNKPAPLNEAEFNEIKKHTVYGYRIVQDMSFADRNIEYAVLEHHERQDGCGYPLQIQMDQINHYAKIVAVADVFDAITSERCYRSRISLYEATEEICSRESGYLDPLLTQRFVKYVLNVSPGDTVLLSNGLLGTIVLMNEDEPLRPLVKSGDTFFDLKTDRCLHIMERI